MILNKINKQSKTDQNTTRQSRKAQTFVQKGSTSIIIQEDQNQESHSGVSWMNNQKQEHRNNQGEDQRISRFSQSDSMQFQFHVHQYQKGNRNRKNLFVGPPITPNLQQQYITDDYENEPSFESLNEENNRLEDQFEQARRERSHSPSPSRQSQVGSPNIQTHTIHSAIKSRKSKANFTTIGGAKQQNFWKQKWFSLSFYVNRLVFRLKKVLIFNQPHLLNRIQRRAINDKASGLEEIVQDHDYQSTHKPMFISYMTDQVEGKSYHEISKSNKKFFILRKKLKFFFNFFETLMSCLVKFFNWLGDRIPIFEPLSKKMVLWDSMIFIYTFFLLLLIPLMVTFNETNANLKLLLEQISPLIYGIDTLKQLNTAYFDIGAMVKSRKLILIKYLKGHFLGDVISTIPLFLSLDGFGQFNQFRILYYSHLVDRFKESFVLHDKINAGLNIAELILKVLMINHVLACSWHKIGDYELEYQNQGWLIRYGLQKASNYTKYINSYYYTFNIMSTVGSQIYPETDNEMLFNVIMTIMTSLIFGYTITTIGTIIDSLKIKNENFLQDLAEMNVYMNSHGVAPHLQNRSVQYLEYLHKEGIDQKDSSTKALSSLPGFLQQEVLQDVFSKSLNKVSTLKRYFSPIFLEKLALRMGEQTFGPDEVIIKAGYPQVPCIYIIKKGNVELYLDIGSNRSNINDTIKSVKVLNEGEHFGDLEFFTQQYDNFLSARSLGVSQIHFISLSEFMVLLQDFPEERESSCYLRDSTALYNNYDIIGLSCYSCSECNHVYLKCPYLFYEHSQNRILRNAEDTIKQDIELFKRDLRRQQYNARLNKGMTMINAELFNQDNQQMFDKQSDLNDSIHGSADGDQSQMQEGASIRDELYSQSGLGAGSITSFPDDSQIQHDKKDDEDDEGEEDQQDAKSETSFVRQISNTSNLTNRTNKTTKTTQTTKTAKSVRSEKQSKTAQFNHPINANTPMPAPLERQSTYNPPTRNSQRQSSLIMMKIPSPDPAMKDEELIVESYFSGNKLVVQLDRQGLEGSQYSRASRDARSQKSLIIPQDAPLLNDSDKQNEMNTPQVLISTPIHSSQKPGGSAYSQNSNNDSNNKEDNSLVSSKSPKQQMERMKMMDKLENFSLEKSPKSIKPQQSFTDSLKSSQKLFDNNNSNSNLAPPLNYQGSLRSKNEFDDNQSFGNNSRHDGKKNNLGVGGGSRSAMNNSQNQYMEGLPLDLPQFNEQSFASVQNFQLYFPHNNVDNVIVRNQKRRTSKKRPSKRMATLQMIKTHFANGKIPQSLANKIEIKDFEDDLDDYNSPDGKSYQMSYDDLKSLKSFQQQPTMNSVQDQSPEGVQFKNEVKLISPTNQDDQKRVRISKQQPKIEHSPEDRFESNKQLSDQDIEPFQL